MGTTVNCYLNDIGKVLKKLRVDFAETQKQQAARLGFAPAYLSLVSTDRRGFSMEVYKSIIEHYGRKAEIYKETLNKALVKADIRRRFAETFPNATDKQMIYVIHGVEV